MQLRIMNDGDTQRIQGPEAVLSTVRVPTRTINLLIVVTVYLEVIIIATKGLSVSLAHA